MTFDVESNLPDDKPTVLSVMRWNETLLPRPPRSRQFDGVDRPSIPTATLMDQLWQ